MENFKTKQCLKCGKEKSIHEISAEDGLAFEPFDDKGHALLWLCEDCIIDTRVFKELFIEYEKVRQSIKVLARLASEKSVGMNN